jgi:uncharacterized protein (TIGR00369 family)
LAAESDRTRIRRFRDSSQDEPLMVRASPLAAALEATVLKLDARARRVTASFNPGVEYLQGRGVLQGGVVATMLDFTMAFITMALVPEEKSNATASLNVSYLRPALPGKYIAEAHVERLGRTLAFVRASVRPEEGDEVATATAVFPVFDLQAR